MNKRAMSGIASSLFKSLISSLRSSSFVVPRTTITRMHSLTSVLFTTPVPKPSFASSYIPQPKMTTTSSLLGPRYASTLTPKFTGGKLKPYSAFKRRFKLTGGGQIRYMRPGHVHKRFNKSSTQLQKLAKTQLVHSSWAKTMKKIGFVMRHF